MMSDQHTFSCSLTLTGGYAFTVDFGHAIPPMTIDEPPPIGQNEGPGPTRVLAAAIASCLGSSLLFCLRKARVDVPTMRTDVQVTTGRNAKGRLRVQKVSVRLAPSVPADQHERMTRCLEVFEDYCTVTAAVREGFAIDVAVDTQAS
jgi:organic hydroperoxide reductase OsmC/OhrA